MNNTNTYNNNTKNIVSYIVFIRYAYKHGKKVGKRFYMQANFW